MCVLPAAAVTAAAAGDKLLDVTAASCRILCCSLNVSRKCDIWAMRAGECMAMAAAAAGSGPPAAAAAMLTGAAAAYGSWIRAGPEEAGIRRVGAAAETAGSTPW